MLCATVVGGGKGACNGDSGGPLVTASGDGVTPGQNYQLIGKYNPGHFIVDSYTSIYSSISVHTEMARSICKVIQKHNGHYANKSLGVVSFGPIPCGLAAKPGVFARYHIC